MDFSFISGNYGDLAVNIEIPEPFIIDENKMTFAFNGTCFDIDGIQKIPDIYSVEMIDYDSNFNKSVQIYANTYFLNSFASTFFSLSPLAIDIIQKDLTHKQSEKLKSVIYQYFPGVWIYFLG